MIFTREGKIEMPSLSLSEMDICFPGRGAAAVAWMVGLKVSNPAWLKGQGYAAAAAAGKQVSGSRCLGQQVVLGNLASSSPDGSSNTCCIARQFLK